MDRSAITVLGTFVLSIWLTAVAGAATITGQLTNRETGEKLSNATVRVLNSGKATTTNADGAYRLLLEPGRHTLKYSHVGYYSETIELSLPDSGVVVDTSLIPTLIITAPVVVYDRQYSRAQEIILEAIRRKQEILNRLGEYSYKAYTKAVVTNETKPDSIEIMLITETQSESFWARPDKYKEIIVARRQSANLDPTENLVSIGEILNFNANRLDLGKYEVVSPVADDALNFYDYYLLDSTWIDTHKVYRLEVEAKNQADPLVQGELLIADSTFDVVGVDVGFNEGVRTPFVSNLRYKQTLAQFDSQYWMPVEIAFSAIIEIKFPGIPDKIGFDVRASINDYSFEADVPDVRFDQYVLEVAESADEFDSTAWFGRQIIPLTAAELRGYERIDSLEHAPRPLGKKLLLAGAGLIFLLASEEGERFYHFNRVEGPYTGIELNYDGTGSGLDLWLKGGYAFDARLPQYKIAGRYNVDGRARLNFGVEYSREVKKWEILTSNEYNPTIEALFFKTDPLNFYEKNGALAYVGASPVAHVMAYASVMSHNYRSHSVATNFSLFGNTEPYRPNPNISDGRISSGRFTLQLDSRKLWKNKGRINTFWSEQYTLLTFGAEYSSPDFLSSDFDYRRYWVSFYRRQRTLGMGMTNLWLFGGSATRDLPIQRYYNYAFFDGEPIGEASRFQTVGANYFSGTRSAYAYLRHDFDQYLFRKSGIPLIRNIPFTLNVYGGAFVAEFDDHSYNAGDVKLRNTKEPYTEIGFGLGNLTPFLSIFNMAAYFTWQLSDYDTNDFTFRVGFGF